MCSGFELDAGVEQRGAAKRTTTARNTNAQTYQMCSRDPMCQWESVRIIVHGLLQSSFCSQFFAFLKCIPRNKLPTPADVGQIRSGVDQHGWPGIEQAWPEFATVGQISAASGQIIPPLDKHRLTSAKHRRARADSPKHVQSPPEIRREFACVRVQIVRGPTPVFTHSVAQGPVDSGSVPTKDRPNRSAWNFGGSLLFGSTEILALAAPWTPVTHTLPAAP